MKKPVQSCGGVEGRLIYENWYIFAMASLRFFQDVSRSPRKAENLTHEEDYWIKSAYMGGIV